MTSICKKAEWDRSIAKPPAAGNILVIFPEILSRFSLAKAPTKVFTNRTTKISLLVLSNTSTGKHQDLKICRKFDYGLKSFQAGICSQLWPEKLSDRNLQQSASSGPDHLTAVTRHRMNRYNSPRYRRCAMSEVFRSSRCTGSNVLK